MAYRNIHAEALQDRIDKALDIAFQFGQTKGDMHKMWVIDQLVRVLTFTPAKYEEFVREYKLNDDGEETEYEWDTEIAP